MLNFKQLWIWLFCVFPLAGLAGDFDWWNQRHGWQPGMPGWRNWLIISPGYLGPNGLPVPSVHKGVLAPGTELELGSSLHFMTGDNTQDLFGRFLYVFPGQRVGLELSGVLAERFAMSETIRDERFARAFDGKGIAGGDLYFSTLVQLLKDRRLPDTVLRLAGKTASGSRYDAARYSDTPAYFFDLSFSKPVRGQRPGCSWLPFAGIGFYSWQTNDELNWQNDALMYSVGLDRKMNEWTLSQSLSGYRGYKDERDSPAVYTFDLQRKMKQSSLRVQFLQGLKDWKYTTFRVSLIRHWK